MKQFNTQAIILKRITFGEADRILTVLTPDRGKLSLIAKGVRRSKSKLAGGLELFSISDILYIDGKSDLKTVVSARLKIHYRHIVDAGMNTTMVAYEFLKLIDTYTQEECDASYFTLLERGLESLDAGEDLNVVRAWFLTQLLSISGRGLNVRTQVNGDDLKEDACYTFDPENMGFIVHESGSFEPKHIKFIRLLGKADSPQHLLRINDAHQLAATVTLILEQTTQTRQI